MGRNGPTAKTKTVLKTACKTAQFGNMQNLTNQNVLNPSTDLALKVNLQNNKDVAVMLFLQSQST